MKDAPANAEPAAGVSNERIQVSGWEWGLVGLIVVVGAWLRLTQIGDAAVEHFDAGVYASNLYAQPNATEYPQRHLYAPPLWPRVIEEAMLLAGGSPSAAIWPSAALGILLVPLLWWVGRTWFLPEAGLVAALLAAVDPMLIAYSREALTDGPLAFAMTAALFAMSAAVTRGTAGTIIWAGLLAALAWSVKYSGWLALAAGGSGTLAHVLTTRPLSWTPLKRWAGTLGIAVAAWSPVWIGLQAEGRGGYAAVSANHAQYFHGFGGWAEAAGRHLEQLMAFPSAGTGLMTLITISFAMLFLSSLRIFRHGSSARRVVALTPLTLSASGCFWLIVLLTTSTKREFVAVTLLTLWVGIGAVITAMTLIRQPERGGLRARAGAWMLLAWLGGMALAIPLYTPYPRLLVPLLPGVHLLMGVLVLNALAVGKIPRDRREQSGVDLRWALPFALTAVLAGGFAGRGLRASEPSVYDGRALALVATDLVSALKREAPKEKVGLYVYGEPSLFFHLEDRARAADAGFISQPSGNLGMLNPGTTGAGLSPFLVVGPHGRELSPEVDDEPRLEKIADVEAEPGLIVSLNEGSPGRDGFGRPLRYTLYRVWPK